MALISVFTAEPGKGKTQAALTRLGKVKAVFFCPSPRNKNALLNALPWAFAREVVALEPDELKRFQDENPRVRLVLGYGEAQLLGEFMDDAWNGWAFVFDDAPQLFPKPSDAEHLVKFLSGIRHRDGLAIITTQRVNGVLPPFVRTIADEIAQVGPLVAEDEAKVLYIMGASARYARFKDFYADIKQNPPFTLFVIKGEIPVDSKRKA